MRYREKTSTKGYDLNKTPSEMTQQELYLEIARLTNENDKLKRTKKFGLVWENKNDAKVEEVRRSAPILLEDSSKRVINDPNDVNHVLINGDNFQAMTALRATHAGKVDVIYIDPPYNTGNKDFIYNDNYLDKEDGYRHSKWLSFMQKRLILARELLSETGVIFVSIDDNEQARLKLLMDDIFGPQNFVANMIWKSKSGGASDSSQVATDHEYILGYAKDHRSISLFKDRGAQATTQYNQVDSDGRRYSLERLDKQNLTYSKSLDYEIVDKSGNSYALTHKDPERPNAIWRWSKQKVESNYDDLVFKGGKVYTKNYEKTTGHTPRSLLTDDRFGRSRTGSTDLAPILNNFSYPKPIRLIKYLASISADKNSIILDFFAGSGTTAHAVAELNKEDGGRRQCILITDGGKTETAGESSKNAGENAVNIAEEITYERVKRVLTGENWADGKEHEPLGGNLFYLNTVVKYVGTIDAKSKEPYFCPSNSTTFSLDTGLWHPILEEVGASAEYLNLEHDYKLFALPKDEDGKQNYALTINATDWEFPAFKEWFDKNMPEDSTVFLYADNYSHGGCEWMEELETGTYPRLTEVNITKRLVNNHNWVAHSFLKTDI